MFLGVLGVFEGVSGLFWLFRAVFNLRSFSVVLAFLVIC